jgi:hypothetical protein
MRKVITIDDALIAASRQYGVDLVDWYASDDGKRSASRSRSGDRGTERNPIRLGQSKVGECAVALFCLLDPRQVIKFDVGCADQGNDLVLPSGKLVDVKTTETWKRFLIWSKEVNDLYWSKRFDLLVSVTIDENDWRCCWLEGCLSKQEFWDRKQIADGVSIGAGLEIGTWFVRKNALRDPTPLRAGAIAAGPPFVHYCNVCGEWGTYGHHAPLPKPHGYFCKEHRP